MEEPELPAADIRAFFRPRDVRAAAEHEVSGAPRAAQAESSEAQANRAPPFHLRQISAHHAF